MSVDGPRSAAAGPAEPVGPGGEEHSEDLDGLRRRVYGPDAHPDDVARYAAALQRATAAVVQAGAGQSEAPAVIAEAGPPEGAARPDPVGGRRVRRRPVLIGAATLAVVLGVGVAVAQRSTAPAPRPSASATATALSVDTAARTAFLRGLGAGGTAGIGFWLGMHPEARPDAARWAGAVVTELPGSGTSTIDLNPPRSATDGGRATVIVVLAADASIVWTAYTLAIDENRTVYLSRIAQRAADSTAGQPTSATFTFAPGAQPMRLRVAAPRGVRWDATVVFTR